MSAKERNLHCSIMGLSSAMCSVLLSLGAKAAYRMHIAEAQHLS